MQSIGTVVILQEVLKYENDISTEEASESKGSRLQSKNGNKVRKKGSCSQKSKGQKASYYFREIMLQRLRRINKSVSA